MVRKLRTLALFLLLPSIASALGIEDIAYYGLYGSGKVLKISYIGDPQPWSRQQPVYGAAGIKPFSFCWKESIDEAAQLLVCAANRASRPTLIYRANGISEQASAYDARTPAGEAYRRIAKEEKLGDGSARGDGTLEAIYECKVGCTKELPRYIFEIARYD